MRRSGGQGFSRPPTPTDKKIGITNDPNTWSDDPRYTLDLFKRVTMVSVRTVQIVASRAKLTILTNPCHDEDPDHGSSNAGTIVSTEARGPLRGFGVVGFNRFIR